MNEDLQSANTVIYTQLPHYPPQGTSELDFFPSTLGQMTPHGLLLAKGPT